MFSLKHYVLEIVRSGSFSVAAEHLFVSQPSLSASIKRLENRIGEPLFDRSVHPVRLTKCGEEYVRIAQSIETMEKDFQDFLEDERSHQSGQLTIGASNSKIIYVLPPLLTKFSAVYPQIQVSLVENTLKALRQALDDGEIDLMVDSDDKHDPTRFDEYIYRSETFILAVPEHFPCNESMKSYRLSYEEVLADAHTDPSRAYPALSLLGDTPFLITTPNYKWQEAMARQHAYHPKTVFSIGNQSTRFQLAADGIGCTIIADTVVKNSPFRPNLCFYKLPDPGKTQFIHFHKKKGRRLTFAMRAFLSCAGIEVPPGD